MAENSIVYSITLPDTVAGKPAIIEFVTSDSDVQFHWSILLRTLKWQSPASRGQGGDQGGY